MTRARETGPGKIHEMANLDFLRGLADRRSVVFVERLPGLRVPTRATLVRLRRNQVEQMNELTLELNGDTELASVLGQVCARGECLERMTIAPPDYAAMVELRKLMVARIDGPRGDGSISVYFNFRS